MIIRGNNQVFKIIIHGTQDVRWFGKFCIGWRISRGEWWGWIIRYLKEREFGFSYWAVDGEQRFGQDENFGLLLQDYEAVRDEWKLQICIVYGSCERVFDLVCDTVF